MDENKSCFLCDLLDDTISDVQGHFDDVRDRENEVDFIEGENGFGINNSTHTKKVIYLFTKISTSLRVTGVGGWHCSAYQQNHHC